MEVESGSFLEDGHQIGHQLGVGRGAYIYVLEGGPVRLNEHAVPELGAAKVIGGLDVRLEAENDTELLVVGVPLAVGQHYGMPNDEWRKANV